jgi:hypothetical protein
MVHLIDYGICKRITSSPHSNNDESNYGQYEGGGSGY